MRSFRKQPRIVIFNHKGGVGKTTLTVNIAAALGELGKKVLLVDSDPQCNVTSYLVEEDVVDSMLDVSDGPEGQTIWTALKPVAEGTGSHRVITPLERLKNVSLIPGDILLADFEQEMNSFWIDCYTRKARGYRGTSALSSLIDDLVVREGYDLVFYDAGPNIGPLNRAVLLDCDGFLVPAVCDLFSIRALKTLGHTLARWTQEWNTICELAPDNQILLPGVPAFLGHIVQRFRVYGSQPALSYAKYLPLIEEHIQSDLVEPLRHVNRDLVASTLKLGQVKDFGSIAAASQNNGQAMWNASSGTPAQLAEARTVFLSLAKELLKRVGQ